MRKLIPTIILLCAVTATVGAQVTFRTEYIGKSRYKDIDNKKNGGRGDALIHSGSAMVPFSFAPTDDGRMKAWGMTLNSSYTTFTNNEAMLGLSPGKIFNNRVGVVHISPLRQRWSIMATLGAGIYAPHTNLGKTRFDEVLFDGAVLFVWHLRPNLDVGLGAAFNSSFGYPMGFPGFYIKWTTTGRFFVNLQMMNGASLSGGVNAGRHFSLALVYDMNGSVAMEKVAGKKMMFSHSWMTLSLQPEFRIGKHVSIPVRAGMGIARNAYYEERTLRAFFKSFGREYDPHFQPAAYFSAGVNLSF